MNPADGDHSDDRQGGSGDQPALPAGKQTNPGSVSPEDQPDWATSLRRMYDGVVEEPLPAAFEELLRSLDAKSAD